MSKKSNAAETEKRVNKIYDLLLAGASRAQIIQYASDKGRWDVTERQIDTYIAEATDEIKKRSQIHRDYEFGKSLARLELLFFNAMTYQNHSLALGVVKEINRMLGFSTLKAEITTTNEQSINKPTATDIAKEMLRLKDSEETEEKIN